MLFRKHTLAVLATDLLLVLVAWQAAFWLRFNLEIPAEFQDLAVVAAPLPVALYAGALVFFHVHRQRRADAAELVGAGRRKTPDHGLARWGRAQGREHGLGQWVRRAAQADAVLPAGRGRAHTFAARHDQGKRPGPKRRHERTREVGHRRAVVVYAVLEGGVRVGTVVASAGGQVHDQRVVGRAALGGENLRHGGCVVGIGCQAIHGLGWQAK